MWTSLISVALGGAIGASLRFGAGMLIIRTLGQTAFPMGVISVNIIGSFIMGFFWIWSQQKGFEHLNLFVMTGILGGFTTFSAFSLEAFSLFEKGQLWIAFAYILASVCLSILGLVAGIVLARGLWA